MNLKIRLAVLYSLSVFIILVASAVSIYILHENFRKEEFIKRLVIEASETFQIFSFQPDISPNVIEELNDKAKTSLPEEETFIFNSSMRVIYSSSGNKTPAIP
jgi:hypothetical protein